MSTHHMDPAQRERLFRQEEARLCTVFAQLERTVRLGRDLYVQDGLNEFNDKLADAEHADELLAQLSTPVYLQKMTLEQLSAQLLGGS